MHEHAPPPAGCDDRVDLPYPPVRIEGKNPAYACEMLSNMAAAVSEMSDISRYFYISVVSAKKSSFVSACFHSISIVEMHHLQIFAELALLLGADPRLWSGRTQKRWWSPSFIRYPRGLRALIAESIQAEEEAILKYSRQACAIRDPNIEAILRRIVLDEERHLEIFREMYSQL